MFEDKAPAEPGVEVLHAKSTFSSDSKPHATKTLTRGLSEIVNDHVAGPAPLDPAESVAPKCVRTIIYVLQCQLVQMFMSFDGGALPASLDTIQAEMNNSWSESELGLLGAMDKIGNTATSLLWGRGLQLCNAKLLLVIGLAMNTVCTGIFALLRNKEAMYATKFFMGASESLQGVWATVWTLVMAPPERKTLWLSLGAVSAGLGNGIGTGVAGFGTANGLSYSFAFLLETAILAALLVALICTKSSWLGTVLPKKEDSDQKESLTRSNTPAPRVRQQLKDLYNNRVYLWTCLAISSSMFQMSGIQFLWVRVFVEVWDLNKNFVTVMFLLVTGIGGGIGIAVGPNFIDKAGGFGTPPGVTRSLGIVYRFCVLSAFVGVGGSAFLYGKLRSKDEGISSGLSDYWLWLTFIVIFFIWAARNASVAALCGINVEVVAEESRTFATGAEMTIRNLLGYAAGPLVPGLFMDAVASGMGWNVKDDPALSYWQLCWGLAFVFLTNVIDVFLLSRAYRCSSLALKVKQDDALQALRTALMSEDFPTLQKAVHQAKVLELHLSPAGASVMGMANEVIGAYKSQGQSALKKGVTYAEVQSPTSATTRLFQLEREIESLRAENAALKEKLAEVLVPSFKGERRQVVSL